MAVALTVVDLLKGHDRVGRQALLRVLIQQEGFGRNRALLRWQHGGVLRGSIHDRHGGQGGDCQARAGQLRDEGLAAR